MVNTGRPSGACGVCRERRIKCDETKPACLKCIRSGRSCSGYSHGLKLRDQTQKTIIKARLGKPRPRRLSNPRGSAKFPAKPKRDSSDESSAKKSSSRPRSLSLPNLGRSKDNGLPARRGLTGLIIKPGDSFWPYDDALAVEAAVCETPRWKTIPTPFIEQARCYFLSSYVVYCPKSSDKGMFTFIPSLLSCENALTPHFDDLFTAVSIATFSMRSNVSHATNFSRLYYGRGVAELRKALNDEALVKSDATLASTILLGFYEGIVSEGAAIASYNPHFEGALTLLRLRGDEQFSTRLGTEMFDFVMQVLMRQYELTLYVTEEDLCRWSVQAAMHPNLHRPHMTAMWVADLRLKVARLVETYEKSPKTTQTAMEVLGAAQTFERMVTQRFESVGEEWTIEENPATGGKQFVYPDWWTATRSLNKYAFRLLLCHIIADVSDWLDGTEGQFQGSGMKAAAIAKEDIENIMASIPYLCGWKAGEQRGATSPCGRDDVSSAEGITSLLVIWPLFVAGESRFATDWQREYIQRKLGWIGDHMGVRHARGVAQHLQNSSRANTPYSAVFRESKRRKYLEDLPEEYAQLRLGSA